MVGTEVRLQDGKIEALSQKVQACAFGQASAALVAQRASGRDRAEIAAALDQLSAWLAGETEQVPDWAGIEALAPARSRRSRHGAILLPFRALLAAFDA
jgi:NifU-like protein involved in Fe-S cluster formation